MKIADVPKENIATLHAHAYRALGFPELVEKHLAEWNAAEPGYALSGAGGNLDEPDMDIPQAGPGDAVYSLYQIMRARMVPPENWPSNVGYFAKRWEAFKTDTKTIDFTDMIERAYRDVDKAPDDTRVFICDEAQDFTRLEFALAAKWGKACELFLVAGDDDQAIFSFKGADANAFLNLPCDESRVLSQSYRVPRSVLEYSQSWIKQLSHREEKLYLPRCEDGVEIAGRVRRCGVSWRAPDALLSELRGDETCMVLTSCSYMLEPLRKLLRQHGLTYHNPYRTARRDWNPLYSDKGTTTIERLVAFLAPFNRPDGKWTYWTGAEFEKWASNLNAAKTLKHGAKAKLKNLTAGYTELTVPTMQEFLSDTALFEAMAGSLDWLAANIVDSKRSYWEYPLAVYKHGGFKALVETPKLILGTMHSVKGGQADRVWVFPDISAAAIEGWMQTGDEHDAIVRQFYVAFTRARSELSLCEPSGGAYVEI